MTLPKWKRNEIFEAVQKVGLRPEEFGWDGESDVDRLTHGASRAHFMFGGPNGYSLRYASGEGTIEKREKASWAGVMQSVDLWLWAVKSDCDTPDLWGDLSRQREMLGPASGGTIENIPFTAEERGEIATQLRLIQEHVKRQYTLSENESVDLDERLAYIEEAAGRIGRIDWRNAAVGAMLAAVVTTALPPEVARAVIGMLSQAVAHFLLHG